MHLRSNEIRFFFPLPRFCHDFAMIFPFDSFGKNGGMPSPKTGSRIFFRIFFGNLSEMSGISDPDDDMIQAVKF